VTWLNNFELIKFTKAEDIPYSIQMRNVTFIETENGKMPILATDGTSTTYMATKVDDGGYLTVDNYYAYISDFCAYVLGVFRVEEFAVNGVEGLSMDDETIKIFTHYHDVLSIDV
jgi:hypothetical protein